MRNIKTYFVLLLAFILSVNSQVKLLEDSSKSIGEYEEEINKFLSELKSMLQDEIKENTRDANIGESSKNWIRSDLLEKIKNLKREDLWDLSMKVELLFTTDEKQAKINLDKWEKASIIDYLTRKFDDKPELKELFQHLQEKTCQELRRIAKDIEYRYESEQAKEIIEKVEKIYIIDYLTTKDRKDKKKVEKFMEEYFKDKPIPLPIGGLHEYLALKGKDDLIDIAMAIEFYHRKITGDPEKPQYHEKLHLMTEHHLRVRILDEVEEHPELEDDPKLIDSILIEYRNYKPPKNSLEINTYLLSLNRDNLMKLAFQTEKIHKKSIGAEGAIGGMHDYIWRLSDEQIREIINKETQEHIECNSAEKLKTLINQPEESHNISTIILLGEPDEKIKVYLQTLKRNDLMKLAFETEVVHKKSTGGEGIMGGLHDYIWKLSDDEIRQIIMKESGEHVELDSQEKLRALMGIDLVFSSSLPTNNEVKNYLLTLERQDLMKLAYETEKVHKQATGSEGTMGGYHDFIWRMSDDEVREIILKESNEHVEINSKEKLKALLEDNLNFISIKSSNAEVKKYLLTLTREDLEKLAYVTENIIRNVTSTEEKDSGIHYYIWRLSDDEIRDFIITKTEENEQLNSKEKLIKLLQKAPNLKITSDEIINYLRTLKREDLIILACKTEKVHKNAIGEGRFGGVNDYIINLSDEQIRRYIMKECDDHEEINSKEKLMALINSKASDPKINEYLLSLSREDLIKLSYETEKIHKKAIGIEGSLSGLHDYIWRLTDDDIRKIILREAEEHHEISSVENLKMLLENHNSNIVLLSMDLISNIHEKINLNKKVKLQGPISTLINISSKKMLIKILYKCLDTINLKDKEIMKNIEFGLMEENHLRKFLKNFIRKHEDKLNKEEIFYEFIKY